MIPKAIQDNRPAVVNTLAYNGLSSLISKLDDHLQMKRELAAHFRKLDSEHKEIPSELDWIYSCYKNVTVTNMVGNSSNQSKN